MKPKLVRIRNSRWVRISEAMIKEFGLESMVEMSVCNYTLVIVSARGWRHGWDDAFKAMAAAGDDAPLLPDVLEGDADELDRTS